MCPMTVRTTCPGAQVDGRVHPVPDAGGRAREHEVARLEGDDLAHVGDQVDRREDELRRAARLAHDAVDLAA